MSNPRSLWTAGLLGLVSFALVTNGLEAQAGAASIPDRIGPTVSPVVADHDYRAGVAGVRPGRYARPVVGALPPLQPGPSTPQNEDPPGRDVPPQPRSFVPGGFRFFNNRALGVSSTTVVGEPSSAQIRDTVLQVGGNYAAISRNSGRDWEEHDPNTFFPALDGGFCCDQRVKYVRSHDLMVWLIEYGYSARTSNGSFRIAVARSRDEVRSGDPADWRSYIYSPRSFGFASGTWLDCPDIAVSGEWLHVSANVFNSAGRFVDVVRWRMELDDLAAGSSASMTYSTGSSLGGGRSYRFAEGGDGSSIYFASFRSTTELRIWRNTDATGSNTRWDRSVNNWTNAVATCPGPDGRDWCGHVVGRLRGAFGDSNRIGFVWTSAGNGGSRPQPYSRIVTFDVNTLTKLSDNDQWSSSLAFTYGAAASNALGHIGLVFAVGGPTSYVHSSATIVDQYQGSFGGMTTVSSGGGNSGPNLNRWGDFFDVQRHPTNSHTFVGTGMRQLGGPHGADSDPRFLWFGREDYEPTNVSVTVESPPITGVGVAIDIADVNGNQDGVTDFTRVFFPRQGLELTAPLFATVGASTWVFERWAHRTTPTVGFSLKPIGERVLTITDIGSVDDTAQARYVARRVLEVKSLNPASGVPIAVSAADVAGDQNGSTMFSRLYRDGASVTLTAPSAVGFNPFKRWVLDGIGQRIGVRTTTLTMSATRQATAEYYLNVGGQTRTIGAGCRGTVGEPRQSIRWPSRQQGPQQGAPISYLLAGARANSVTVLHLGLDDRFWNGMRLPLALDFLGMRGCFLYHDLVVSPLLQTSRQGTAQLDLTLPVNPRTVGVSIFSTWAVVDPGANQLGLVHSNAMEMVLGGNR